MVVVVIRDDELRKNIIADANKLKVGLEAHVENVLRRYLINKVKRQKKPKQKNNPA